MNRVVLLAAGSVLIALAVLLAGHGEREEIVAAAPVPPVAPEPLANVERQGTSAVAQRQPVGDVALHGVLLAGAGGAASQVLLKVDGGPEQLYRVGDQVIRGWSVHEIGQYEAVLRQGGNRARLAMAAAQAATGESAFAGPAQPPSVAKPSAPAPGFMAGPPPHLTDEGASERNRRFLEARQGRAQAR